MNQAAHHSQHRCTEDDLKILLRILSKQTLQLLPLYTSVTGQHMPAHLLTQSESALEWTVEFFGNLLIQLEELLVTHNYCVVIQFCHIENIGYRVLRYLYPGILPFEEFAEEGFCTRGSPLTVTIGTNELLDDTYISRDMYTPMISVDELDKAVCPVAGVHTSYVSSKSAVCCLMGSLKSNCDGS